MLTKSLKNGVWICLIFYIESISKRCMSKGVHRGGNRAREHKIPGADGVPGV